MISPKEYKESHENDRVEKRISWKNPFHSCFGGDNYVPCRPLKMMQKKEIYWKEWGGFTKGPY